MTPRKLISILCLMLSLCVQGAVVKGRLIDSTFNEGEPFATIRLYKSGKDNPLTTVLSDVDGNFTVSTPKGGDYRIECSAMAKTTLTKEISVTADETLDLGEFTMTDDALSLSEVVVTAQRPLVSMSADEMTYNVSADSDSRTLSLLDMLRKVPMVTVDGEDNISVSGSHNFQVFVDGRPSLLFSGNPSRIFKSMPASAVLKVEVITNPGARFDAEGAGGILNLVMNNENGKENVKAYDVAMGLKGGNRDFGGNIYVNGQIGRISASLNFFHNDNHPGNTEMSSKRSEGETVTTTHTVSRPKLPFTMGNLNLGYDIDSLTSIGASFAVNRFKSHAGGNINNSMVNGDITLFDYQNRCVIDNKRQGLNGSVYLNRYFGADRRHNLQLTYQLAHEKNINLSDNYFTVAIPTNTTMDARTSDSRMNTTEHQVLVDFSTKQNEHKFSVGAKGSFRTSSADNTYLINNLFDPQSSVTYKDNTSIGAAYAEYGLQKGLFSAKAGLRYEHTWQSERYLRGAIDEFKTDYGNLVPSASVGFNIGPTSNIGVNYNMRISRPGITYLNPYVDKADPLQLTYGNPDLKVEKTHNAAIVYNLFARGLVLNATMNGSHSSGGIEQYSFIKDGVLNTTYGNIVDSNSIGLNIYLNWQPFPKTGVFVNGGVSYLNLRSHELDCTNSGFQANFMVGLNQQLPFGVRYNAFLMTSTKNRTLQGWTTGTELLTLNISKTFLGDKLGVTMGFNTGLSKGGKMKMDTYTETATFSNLTTIRIPMASFNLGVTYRFGSSAKVKEVKRNLIENDYIDARSDMEKLSGSTTSETTK